MVNLTLSYLLLFLSIKKRDGSFKIMLCLSKFDNKTIPYGHSLPKIRTMFTNLGGVQCFILFSRSREDMSLVSP